MRAALILALLAGCATTDLPPAPGTANVSTPTPCLTRADVPTKPEFVTDAQILAVPKESVVFLLGGDRLARMDYEGKLEAKLVGCVGEKPVPAATKPPAAEPAKPWYRLW